MVSVVSWHSYCTSVTHLFFLPAQCDFSDLPRLRSDQKKALNFPCSKVLFSLLRTWWRVTWCTLFARRWRCWKNTSRSCTRGTLSWNGRTLCWSRWLILSSSASFPVNSFMAAAAAAAARRCSSSSSSSLLPSPPYHSPRALRLSAISPTSPLRDSALDRTCAKTRSAHEQLWDVLLAMQLPALP